MRRVLLILSWALYDLANQFFVLNIMSLYFVRWLTLEKGLPEVYYSVSFGASMFFVAALAPFLGAISDLTGCRRRFLVYFTLISVGFTILLGLSDNVILALIFFAVANFGCQLATVFYNAQLVDIAPKNKLGLVSGFGRTLAYSGAILALYFVKPAVLKSGPAAAFAPSGVLFLIFALPCMIFVRDKTYCQKIPLGQFLGKERIGKIFRSLKTAVFDAKSYPGLPDFLKASFLCLSAVNAVILFMSVYATRVFGLNESQIVNLIAFSTVFAIFGSIISGFISDLVGHKRCLCVTFALWGVCFVMGSLVKNTALYWLVGALVGMAMGSTWVVLRVQAVRLVPKEKISEVFGLCNLAGYLSAMAGAFFWAAVLRILSGVPEVSYRVTLLSLNLFILPGLVFLFRLPRDNAKNK